MKWRMKKSVFYLDSQQEQTPVTLSCLLTKLISEHRKKMNTDRQELVIVCIGSDRVTGDSLGPLIGYKLEKRNLPGIHIYGTLNHPVHALNLQDTVSHLNSVHPDAFVIAIDASLGTDDHVGFITVGKGSLYPGAGVHKDLPPVGNLFITGIVDTSGSTDQMALHTTRLSSVMNLADCITSGVVMFHRLYVQKDAALQTL